MKNIHTGNWGDSLLQSMPIPIEFETNEDGWPIGYKVLVMIPNNRPWLMSPNLEYEAIWENNQLESHATPDILNPYCGIHGTKRIDDLESWWHH